MEGSIVNIDNITIASLIATALAFVWGYFTKKEAERAKQERDDIKDREASYKDSIKQKDELIVKLAQDSIKGATEVKASLDNNTKVIDSNTLATRDLHTVTGQVLQELTRLKALNH